MSELEKEAVDVLTEILASQNLDESSARIFATLYLEPAEICLEELARKTGYSAASISNKVNFIISSNLVRKTRKPGSKKIYVYMEKDLLKSMRAHFVEEHEKMILLAKKKVPDIISKLKEKGRSEEEKKKQRILEDYMKMMQKFEIIAKEIDKRFEELERIK